MATNLDIARDYVRALEAGVVGDALARFFAPDVEFHEKPNRISPHGSTSDLNKALQGAERGQQMFSRQTYTIINTLTEGERVALELDWVGITKVQLQNLPPGSAMRDHAAIFLQFRDGRIVRQSHYDCFEPW